MAYIKENSKIGLVALLSFVLVHLGSSQPETSTNFDGIKQTGMRSFTVSSDISNSVEQGTDTTDHNTDSSTQKAKNCKDVKTLEKVSGLPRFLRKITGDRKLRPKDKVPAFTLPKIDGEEVSLYDVLEENDYVLIDFWATACGPCIAQFPKLKEIYSTYADENFEIVSVCTDFTHEQWAESLEEHNLPWIDVGEINDQYLDGPTSKAFRLRGLPRSYLVDTNGCILHTHIFPIELEKFLQSEYGKELESEDRNGVPEISDMKAN